MNDMQMGQAPQPMPQMPQQGGINPNLALFLRMAQQGQGGQPPQGGMGMQQQTMQGPPPQMQGRFSPQEMGAMGQYGDKIVAHLTPGEMAVPKEVQTPKVLATLKKAFGVHGINPQQFTAGSPQASTNPQTGMEQFNWLQSLLPMAGGIAATAMFPELSPLLMGGLGTTAGGLLAGEKPLQAALGGAGSAAGGYLGGKLMGGMAGQAAAPAINNAAQGVGQAASAAAGASTAAPISNSLTSMATNLGSAASKAASAPSFSNMFGMMNNPGQSIGSTVGSMIGNSLGAPVPKTNAKSADPGFDEHLPAWNPNGSYADLLGYNTFKGATPSFNNYNPYNNAPAAYNFYPNGR